MTLPRRLSSSAVRNYNFSFLSTVPAVTTWLITETYRVPPGGTESLKMGSVNGGYVIISFPGDSDRFGDYCIMPVVFKIPLPANINQLKGDSFPLMGRRKEGREIRSQPNSLNFQDHKLSYVSVYCTGF